MLTSLTTTTTFKVYIYTFKNILETHTSRPLKKTTAEWDWSVVNSRGECKQDFRSTAACLSNVGDLDSLVRMHRALRGPGNGLDPGLSRQRSTAAMETQTAVRWMTFWTRTWRTLRRARGKLGKWEAARTVSETSDQSESNRGCITEAVLPRHSNSPCSGWEERSLTFSSCTSILRLEMVLFNLKAWKKS